LVLEYDGVLCSDDVEVSPARREVLAEYAAEGWKLLAIAWRPQIAEGKATAAEVEASFDKTRTLLGLDLEIAYCPHAAGPPICWCRKPLPGLVLEFAMRHCVALDQSLLIGRAAADRTMAQRLGLKYVEPARFFTLGDGTAT
jgi:D-glycero-D-manno-heptose 1,7-bisphosphate phosphatase